MTSTDTAFRTTTSRRSTFRLDIEGLRAVAIGLVLLYHAGVRQLPGGFVGVDVFFVISGFLITGLLIREIEQNGRISLRRFYVRRAKRLLPATGVVLVATGLLTWLTTSVIYWRDFGLDIVASALYVVNWRLAARSVDYLAEDVGVSPVQHFWSLAVEEQFYIVWPLLMVALAWWSRRRRPRGRHGGDRSIRPVLLMGVLAVITPSLLYSIHLTDQDAALAFFVTPTRLWELGIGALIALGANYWQSIPRGVAIAGGWAGLGVIVASAFLVSASTPWPGYSALAPTLGTAAVIIAGYSSGRAGPAGLLSWRPAVWIGSLSYSLYLWHWPLVVAATEYWGELGARRGLLVVAVSFIPAYLCYRWVENPIRFSSALARSHALTAAVSVAFTAVGAAAGLIVAMAVPTTTNQEPDRAQGATALEADPEQGSLAALEEVTWFTPAPTDAEDDLPDGYADECQVTQASTEPHSCEWGDPEGEVTVAVVGDSKMLQWQSALEQIADETGWRIVSHTKSACGFHAGVQPHPDGAYTACVDWNEAVLTDLIELNPDVVVTSQGQGMALANAEDTDSETREAMAEALATRWNEMADHDIPVVVVLDNPSPPFNVYECVAENPASLQECVFEAGPAIENSAALAQAAAAEQAAGNVATIDMQPWICPEQCVPIIGNVLVYRQGSHLTDTYVRTLSEQLSNELLPHVAQAHG